MIHKLQDIININHLKSILTKINDTFNFAVAIIDNSKKIIATSKWQKIFLELDQKNNKCLKEFEKTFEEIVEIIDYKIPPTLVNKCFQDVSFIATPLFIENKHYGYILAGQFFLKKPDLEFYKNLAKEYGFEEKTYLKIIFNLPVITKKEMETYLSFIHEYLGMSITNYKMIHTNKSYSDFDIKENKEIKNALIASEGRFKKLVESVIDYIYTVKIEKGKVISTSHGPGCVSVTGYTSEEYEKDQYLWYRMVYEEDRDAVIKQSSMMISGKQALPLEHRIIHKNGSIRWVRNTPVLRYNEKHAIIGYDGLIIDITEKKEAEEALKSQEEIFRLFMEYSPIYIFFKDENIRAIQLSRNYEKMLGKPLNEILGKTMDELFPSDMAKSMVALDKHILEEGKPNEVIEELNGRIYSTLKFPIILNGKPTYLAGFTIDITERKLAEEALNESEEKFMKAFHFTNILMAISTIENGKYIEVNESFLSTLGFTRDEVIGKTSKELNIFLEFEQRSKVLKQLQEKGYARNIEVPIMDRNKEIHHGLFSADIITLKKEKYLLTVMADITERKKLEEILEKDKEELKQIIDSSPIIVFYKDKEGKFIRVNKAFAESLKVPEKNFIGKTVFDFYSIKIAKDMTDDDNEVLSTGKPKLNIIEQYESATGLRWVRTDKVPIFDKKSNPIGLIGFAQDITEYKKTEESLRENEMKYRALVENSLFGIGISQQNQIIYANKALMNMYGYDDFREFSSKSLLEYLTPKSQVFIQEWRDKKLKGEKVPMEFEHDIIRKDGEIRTLRLGIKYITLNSIKFTYTTFMDITEQKKAEEALRESEGRFRTVFDNANVGVCLVNTDGYIFKANNMMCQIFGYTKEEIEKMNVNTIAYPEDKELSPTFINNVISGKIDHDTFDKRYIHKDGHLIWGHVSSSVVRNSQGKPLYFISHIQDITERKKAEESLRASETRYKALIESQADLISRYTPDTILTFVNDAYCEFFGKKREELIGKSYMFMIAPEFRETVRKETEDLANNPKQIIGEYLNYRHDGKECWIQWSVQCITDENGKGVELQAVGRDLTERKKVEKDLLESEKKFRTFVEATKEWIWMMDLEGKNTYSNPAIKSILGYEPDELKDVDSFKFMHPDDQSKVKEIVDKKIEEKEGWSNLVIRWIHKDGTFRYLESNAFPIIDSNDNLIGYQGADRDITERKKAEEALIKFNEELEKRVQKRTEELINVNKELESFSYTVSHDLRAPLRSINGFSQILLEGYKDKLDEEAIGYINRIINSSNKLAELIDHLLNLSRITRSEVHKTKVDLSKMANDIIIELKEFNPDRNINFICEKGIIVDADYTLIHSAIYNIIHNAWKYTSKKSKTKIEFGETKKLENRVFYIKDNGAGFDMKYSDKLFKVFQRLHSDKEFEGTGIGLATVNHIINKHGGIIWAESEINKGTTFYFTLG